MNAHGTRARTARWLALAGAGLAGLVAIRTIDAHDLDGLLDGAGARTGTIEGLVVFALAAAAGAAAALARRAPGWATVILAAAGAAGAFFAGGSWLLPAPLLLAGSLWALMAVPDPFSEDAAAGIAEGVGDASLPHAEARPSADPPPHRPATPMRGPPSAGGSDAGKDCSDARSTGSAPGAAA